MTDSKRLRDLIGSNGFMLKFIAGKLNLSPYGFQKKLDNELEFKTSEVSKLCELLKIDSLEEKERIFFAKTVDS